MILPVLLLLNNCILFIAEVIGYHACHSVVMLLDGYYHLCQAILCTVRIVSPMIQYTYTSRQTYGLARVGVLGELVAFVSFVSLSLSVFLESLKHLVDVTLILPKRENNGTGILKAHGHEHIHSLIDRPLIILGVGIYATVSNVLLAIALLYVVIRRAAKLQKRLKERRPSIPEPLPKRLLSKSLLISDTLPLQHSFLQIFSMLIGPVALLTCGVLLVTLSDNDAVLILYSRLVDPIIFCLLFVTFCFMIFFPIREVMNLVLQASPCQMNCSEIEKMLREAIPSISSIHELHIWRLTPQKTLATVHIVFNTKENILDKYQDINFIFQTLQIDHVTIQPEFVLTNDETGTLICQYPCATDASTCRPLQCCETPMNNEPSPVG